MASNPSSITADSVVPMSTIMDALEGVLTEDERQALLIELVNVAPQGVAPGDLITAELFNSILSDINSLKIRIARLEGEADAPSITQTSPSGEIRTNAIVSIIGRNFNREPRRNIVHFGDQQITPLSDGSESRISFLVPYELAGLPRDFDLSVENQGLRSNEISVRVIERGFAQSGNFGIGSVVVPSGPMEPGAVLTLSWPVTADTALADEAEFTLLVNNPQGASARRWQSSISFEPPSPAPIEAGQALTVTATIETPTDATAADLSLSIRGQEGIASGTSQPPIEWRAGRTLDVSSPEAELTIQSVSNALTEDENMSIGGSVFHGVRMAPGAAGRIQLELVNNSDANGDFTITAAVTDNRDRWSIANPNPSNVRPLPAGGDHTISVDITNRDGQAGDVTFLRVSASQTSSQGGISPFISFAIIPLQLT